MMEDGDEVVVRFPIGEVFPPVSYEDGEIRIGDCGFNLIEDLVAWAEAREKAAAMAEKVRVADAPVRCVADLLP